MPDRTSVSQYLQIQMWNVLSPPENKEKWQPHTKSYYSLFCSFLPLTLAVLPTQSSPVAVKLTTLAAHGNSQESNKPECPGLFRTGQVLEVSKYLVYVDYLESHTVSTNFMWTFIFQVGTGYSFTVGQIPGYSTNEVEVADNLYSCLEQFFTLLPKYQANDFYLTGEVITT